MSLKRYFKHQKYDQINKRVPPEIWEHILNRLYPSQLSRMSMVNKNLNMIVSSLEVWLRMFRAAYGPKAQLRLLMSIPKAESSYMIFMCASSRHVCERCFGRTGYDADKLYKLPLPIPVLLPRRSTYAIKYVGDRFDPNWTVRMCLSCRQDHISNLEEPVPRHITTRPMDWTSLCEKHPCARRTQGLRSLLYGSSMIDELSAFNHIRQYFGGDIGIKASRDSTEAYGEMTETRIRWYELQE